jgi:hypothetical protein
MTTYPEELKDDLEPLFGTSSGTDVRITLLSETTHMMNNLLIANLVKKILSIKMSKRVVHEPMNPLHMCKRPCYYIYMQRSSAK